MINKELGHVVQQQSAETPFQQTKWACGGNDVWWAMIPIQLHNSNQHVRVEYCTNWRINVLRKFTSLS